MPTISLSFVQGRLTLFVTGLAAASTMMLFGSIAVENSCGPRWTAFFILYSFSQDLMAFRVTALPEPPRERAPVEHRRERPRFG